MATWKEILNLSKNNKPSNQYQAAAPKGVTYTNGRHGGIDVVLKNDNVPSFSSGTVVRTRTGNTGFGNYVVVKDNRGFYNYYAHLNSISVKEGQQVNEGDILGIQGQTGQATGKHLHLEIRSDMDDPTSTMNPSKYYSENPKLFYEENEARKSRMAVKDLKNNVSEIGTTISNLPETLQGWSLGALLRLGFIGVGVFCIYVAVTKGLFGGSGE